MRPKKTEPKPNYIPADASALQLVVEHLALAAKGKAKSLREASRLLVEEIEAAEGRAYKAAVAEQAAELERLTPTKKAKAKKAIAKFLRVSVRINRELDKEGTAAARKLAAETREMQAIAKTYAASL